MPRGCGAFAFWLIFKPGFSITPDGVDWRNDSDVETDAGTRGRAGDPCLVVKRFGYWRDALCIGGGVLYAANRWLVKPHVHTRFLTGQFNDLLLIPCALPLFLQIQRWLGWRNHDDPPRPGEIVFHLCVWSVLFEVIGPHLMRTVGDPLDVAAYAVGALFAGWWWHRKRRTLTTG